MATRLDWKADDWEREEQRIQRSISRLNYMIPKIEERARKQRIKEATKDASDALKQAVAALQTLVDLHKV